ncbi:hypothetical protein FE501_19410, partial [Clostridioides difficile]|nr:hypothetical protein [Clostridioides difficile]
RTLFPSPPLVRSALAGPVGERNLYALRPRGRIAAVAASETALLLQLGAILGTGNAAVVVGPEGRGPALDDLPATCAARVARAP